MPVEPQLRQITSCRARAGQHARSNTANRAPNMLMHHGHVPVHVRRISILWNFHTNPYYPSEQQVETPSYGVGEHLKNDKLRVAWHGVSNTRARRTNTANRVTNMPMHHSHVLVPVYTISIKSNIQTNPYQSTEATETTG